MSNLKGFFEVACCKRRRGFFPGSVLVCSRCDYAETSVMPNESQARDVPSDVWFVYPGKAVS